MELARVKFNLNQRVLYKDIEYIFTACILRQNSSRGNFYYQAELLDNNKNSILVCKLSEVTEVL